MESIGQVVIFTGAGVFSIVASLQNWNWFFEHRKAQFFVKILGRKGTRIFYFLLGAFMLFLGVRFIFV